MADNNPTGLGEKVTTQLGITEANLSSTIYGLTGDTDALLNISANTDPTEGYLGSRDSVASSFGIMNIAGTFFTSLKTLISWVFSGESGEMIIFFISGSFGLLALYWITKWIRNGF